LTKDNPRQVAFCDQLEDLIRRRLTISTNSVQERHANGLKISSQAILMEKGQESMTLIRALATEMIEEEGDRLKERQTTQDKNIEGMKGFAVLLTFSAMCAFLVMAVLFWRASRRTHRAEEALVRSNHELEQGVIDRTAELQMAIERASWLASFPERNPNPIIEVSLADGVVHYVNPYAARTFPDIKEKRLAHPLLVRLKEAVVPLLSGQDAVARREISIGDVCYFQTINYIPEGNRVRVYNSDVTERKRIQADLDSQSADLQLIFDTVPALIFYKDRQHRLLRINHELCRLLGVPQEAVLGKTDQELGSPHATQYFRDEDEVMTSGEAKRGIVEPLDIGTETRWLLTNKLPYRNRTGEIMGVVGFAVDITDRKLAESRLEEAIEREQVLRAKAEASENRFRTLVEQSLVGIYVIQNDRFVYVNPAMEGILGFSATELTSVPFLDFVVPEDRSIVHENVRKRIEGVVASVQYSLRMIRKDQCVAFVEVRGGRSELNGKPAILGTLLDISKRKETEEKILSLNLQLEERVRERTAQLEATNLELEAFSYSVSHDLRAPLRHVHGYVEMLKRATEGQLAEKPQRYLQTISAAAEEMGHLIDDLLEFSRVGRVELREKPVAVRELVDQVIAGLEMAIKGRNVNWKISEFPTVSGDRATLKQVFANLVGNAVKYSRDRDPAEIEIGTSGEKGGRIIVFVRDNGVGFDMQYANKLFGVFQRLHRAEDFEGTGIGLATVRRIVQRHGGETWAEGALEKGASFYFTLKRANV
jgi:PAS domain S-box-containing protein